MAETPEGPQQTREEVNIDQIIKFLQSFGVMLTENRDILSVLPELIKKLEANITKATGTATADGLREFSGLTEEQEGKKKKWETKQKRQEKHISRLENELQEAKRTISDLEARNKQNDNDVEMLKRENRDLSDKNYYKSKCKDLKAKLRTTNEDLGAKTEKIAALGRELASKQEDYDTETQRTRKELTEKEKELAEKKEELQMLRKQHSESFRDQKGKIDESEARIAELGEDLRAKQEGYEKKTQRSRKELAEKDEELAKVMEQLHTIKQQHDESLRSQETKIDELRARNAQLEGERISLQEDYEKEKQRRKQELNEKENALRNEKIERERVKQHFNDNLRDKETKLKRSEACNEELTRENEKSRKRNENLTTEIEKGKQELRHYVERFNHQEEQRKSDLSLKEIEVNKLKGRLSHSQKEVKRLNDELGQFKSRFAGICEKRVKQDQRKVENILASNQQSEVEKDFRDFFDSSREDARDIIQSLYGSEEEVDVHVYYPRIACTILQEGSFDHFLIPIDELNTSEISTDVLDALLISLKETAHICSLECLKEDVKESSWKKWTEWFDKDESFEHAPTREILSKLDGYIKACIRLTWRMVTQLPPLRLEYHSPRFDRHIHKNTAYQNSTEKNPGNEESSGEEILCYLWPGLLDGGDRLILQGQVICKMQREILK